jgi:CRP-like cAMP-binding protein
MSGSAQAVVKHPNDSISFFISVGLFQDVPPRNLLQLIQISELVSFPAGTVIITEGDTTNDFLLVREGTVEVFVQRTGGEVAITRLGPKAYFGEMAVFDNYPRSAGVRAITDVTAYKISREDLRDFLHYNPAVLFQMCTVFTHRLRNTNSALSKH